MTKSALRWRAGLRRACLSTPNGWRLPEQISNGGRGRTKRPLPWFVVIVNGRQFLPGPSLKFAMFWLPKRRQASDCAKTRRLPACFPPKKFGRSSRIFAMQRPQLEHIIRAAAGITGTNQFVIIGSQAVLGQIPNPPQELLASIEADLFSLRNTEDADLIDGTIGGRFPISSNLWL